MYTIEVIENFAQFEKELPFFVESAKKVSEIFGNKFRWGGFDVETYILKQRLTLCRRKGQPIGFMLARLCHSLFDREVIILRQDLLYARPGTKGAYYLMQDFIDFGKHNANHIVTMIGNNTKIKPRSLEKLGFKKLEEYYRIEV